MKSVFVSKQLVGDKYLQKYKKLLNLTLIG